MVQEKCLVWLAGQKAGWLSKVTKTGRSFAQAVLPRVSPLRDAEIQIPSTLAARRHQVLAC